MKTTTFFNKARKGLGLRQKELATLLKISQVNLCKYERGFTEPPGQVVLNLAEILRNRKIILF
jgi:transcriptional regulator with XRE-family HTH domain